MSKRGFAKILPCLLLALGAAIVFGPFLANPFYFDDIVVLEQNAWLKGAGPPGGWFRSLYADSNHVFLAWRPTLMLSFAANAKLLGGTSAGYRLVNILLHFGNAIWIGLLLRRWLDDRFPRYLPWLASALFFFHPIQSIGVYLLWKRSTLLETFWLLTSCWVHVRERERPNYRWPTAVVQCVLFSLAVSTKESGVFLPFYLVGIDAAYFGVRSTLRSRQTNVMYLMMFAIAVVFYWFRILELGRWTAANFENFPNRRLISTPQYALFSLEILRRYLGLWIMPRPLLLDDPPPLDSFPAAGLVTTILGLFAAILLLVRFRAIRWIPIALMFIVLGFLPTSGVAPIYLVMDQIRMYLPIAGFGILMAGTVHLTTEYLSRKGLIRWKDTTLPFLSAVILVYAIFSAIQGDRYRVPVDIWTDVVEIYPESGFAWENLGGSLDGVGKFKAASFSYEEALRVEPDNRGNLVNLLYSQLRSGTSYAQIRETLKKVDVTQISVRHLADLAIVEAEVGETLSAEKHLLMAVQLNPWDGFTHLNLAIFWERQKNLEGARRGYFNARKLMPDLPIARDGAERLGPPKGGN